MTYIQGFLIPVLPGKRDAYKTMAAEAAPLFQEYGATRIVETFGVDVPDGKRTDMKRAVAAEPGEGVVFSWIEWPDKAACDAASQKMQSDDRMKMPDDMPFDPKRMIYAGFEILSDATGSAPFGFLDGMICAVPKAKRDAYLAFAHQTNPAFLQHGATGTMDAWAENIADGKVTDFKKAVAAEEGEAVVFAWIQWPDKATRDTGFAAVMQDPTMQGLDMPFDGSRMIFGGFEVLLDTAHG